MSATSSDNIGLHHKIIKQITKSTLINLWPVIQLHTRKLSLNFWIGAQFFFHRGGWYHNRLCMSALLIKKYNHDYWIGLQTKLRVAHLNNNTTQNLQSQLLAG